MSELRAEYNTGGAEKPSAGLSVEAVDALEGRELDYWISDVVLDQHFHDLSSVPHYSTSIEAAWRVVEHVDYILNLEVDCPDGYTHASITTYGMIHGTDHRDISANAPTAALAICRVALKEVLTRSPA